MHSTASTEYTTHLLQKRTLDLPCRHLEIRLPVSGLERCPACHPERSEGSLSPASQTLRCAQGDRPYLQMSTCLGQGYLKVATCLLSSPQGKTHFLLWCVWTQSTRTTTKNVFGAAGPKYLL